MSHITYWDQDKNPFIINKDSQVGSAGGEGAIYDVIEPVTSKPFVIKLFHDVKEVDLDRLKYFINDKTPLLSSHKFAVPLKILYSSENEAIGFLMNKINHAIDLESIKGPRPSNQRMSWKYIDVDHPNYFRNRISLFLDLAIRLYSCESAGVSLSDLKLENVMVRFIQYDMYIIDIESSQLRDTDGKIVYRAKMATWEYTPPEWQLLDPEDGEIDFTWGSFSFGCMLYEFLFGVHPFCASNKDKTIREIADAIKNNMFVFGKNKDQIDVAMQQHEMFEQLPACANNLKRLFFRCFDCANPKERPTYEEWIQVLEPLANIDCVKSHSSVYDLPQLKAKNYNLLRQNQTYVRLESSKGLIIAECIDIEILVEGEPLCVGKQCYIHWLIENSEYKSLRLEPFGEKVDFEGDFVTTIYETKKFALTGKKKNWPLHLPIDSLTISVSKFHQPKTIKLHEPKRSHQYPTIDLNVNTQSINKATNFTGKIISMNEESVELNEMEISPHKIVVFEYKPDTFSPSVVMLDYEETQNCQNQQKGNA